jgi:hypothetical protein
MHDQRKKDCPFPKSTFPFVMNQCVSGHSKTKEQSTQEAKEQDVQQQGFPRGHPP